MLGLEHRITIRGDAGHLMGLQSMLRVVARAPAVRVCPDRDAADGLRDMETVGGKAGKGSQKQGMAVKRQSQGR